MTEQSTSPSYVIIAGNIGVGKSSLTQRLGQYLGWHSIFEAESENPYLGDFYSDMHRWSFHSQIFFLTQRLHQLAPLRERQQPTVQDRSLYEDAEIFARNLYTQGLLSERDYRTYFDLYRALATVLPMPNLIVYLEAPVGLLAERIAQRGRTYEQSISIAYLRDLNELYTAWVQAWEQCPILCIPAIEYDFVNNSDDFLSIVRQIKAKLEHQ